MSVRHLSKLQPTQLLVRYVLLVYYTSFVNLNDQCKGVLPPAPENPEEGELPLVKELILDACEVSILHSLAIILRRFTMKI